MCILSVLIAFPYSLGEGTAPLGAEPSTVKGAARHLVQDRTLKDTHTHNTLDTSPYTTVPNTLKHRKKQRTKLESLEHLRETLGTSLEILESLSYYVLLLHDGY